MSQTHSGISKIAAVVSMCMMLCFTHMTHAQSNPAPGAAAFDHNKTGYLLKDVHATLRCEQCHVDGIFKNTPKNCAGCHGIGTRVAAKPKPINHVPTDSACETCHVSAANFLVKSYLHIGITGNCVSCHNGKFLGVTGKPADHFLTVLACESCHTNTSTFTGARMDHSGITTGCNTCHGGPQAGSATFPKVVSYPPVHIAISATAECNSCHTTISFGGVAYSHDPTTYGKCGNCHQGQLGATTVSINTATHIPNTYGIACDTCHTITNTGGFTSFKSSTFHLTTVGSGASPLSVLCSSCHNGTYASQGAFGVNTGHVSIGAMDCSTCHTSSNTNSYRSFIGATFSHVPAYYASFPADVPGSPRCDTCHISGTAGAKTKPAIHVPYTVGGATDCNGCHTNATTACATAGGCSSFLGAVWTHTGTYTTFPTAAPASPTCGSCHLTSVGGAKPKPTTHVSTSQDCIVCHTGGASGTGCPNCTTFLGAAFSHQPGIYASFPAAAPATPTCASCHKTGVGQAKQYSATHVATALDCIVCHSNTNTQCPSCVNFTTGGAVFNHVPSPYASWPTSGITPSPTCSSCHNGSTAIAKNTGHVMTTSDCSACHLPGPGCPSCTSFLGATGAPPHNIAPYNTPGTCISCHDGMQATGLSANANHIPIGSVGCDQCHPVYDGTTSINFSSSAVTSIGGTSPRYAMKHSVVTGRCDSCHNGAYAGQGIFGAVGKVTKHIPTAITGSLDCTTCHTTLVGAGIVISSGSADWLRETMNHNGAQGGGPIYCVTCHLSGTTYLGSMQKKSHEGTSTAKDCSRSSCHKPLGSKGASYIRWN